MTEQQTPTADAQTGSEQAQTPQTPAADQQPATVTSIDAHSAGSPERFTEAQQAKINSIIQERLADQQRKHEEALAEAEARAGKSDLEAARLDVEKYQQLAQQAQAEAREAIVAARIDAAIAGSDVRKDRRDAIARLLDRDGLADLDPADQSSTITDRINAVLADYPEWKSESVPVTGGGRTPAPGKNTLTLDQWRGMTLTERARVFREQPTLHGADSR